MKRTLFRLFNLLMACVVLLSSTGFGLVEHSCQMRGKKKTMVVAFSDVKAKPSCATDSQSGATDQTTVRKTVCCQDDHQYENIDVSSSLSQLLAKFVKTVTEAVIAEVTSVLTWLVDWLFAKKSATISAFPSPPSLSGRDILTLVRTLQI
ncbi:hypothetical protein GCM10028805_19630 [Spirosoma harenae]